MISTVTNLLSLLLITSAMATFIPTIQVFRPLSKYFDHTVLKPDAPIEAIEVLCKEAREYDFASVCVNSAFVPLASKLLADSSVMVCAVVGFPLGACSTQTKVFETNYCIDNGAVEIDMVLISIVILQIFYMFVLVS